MEDLTRDHGTQPIDQLMEAWKLSNHDLVNVSTEQLNHKQVQKARKGRQLTLPIMQKVARAFNVAAWSKLEKEDKEVFVEYKHRQLFDYAKGYDSNFEEPNAALIAKQI